MEKQPEHRHKDNVQGSDKSGLSDSCIFDAELLEIGGHAEEDTAGETSGDQCVPVTRDRFTVRIPFPDKQINRDEYRCADQEPDAIKSKGSHIIHSDTLRHECDAPDSGGKEQQERASQRFVCFMHDFIIVPPGGIPPGAFNKNFIAVHCRCNQKASHFSLRALNNHRIL